MDMSNRAMFQNKSDEWATPIDFFEALDHEFHFDIDVCATADNHKCEKYFTYEDDGLKQNWGGVCCVLQSTLFSDR